MVRAFVDAPIDQTITDKMRQALMPMLSDAIEKHSVTQFYVRYHDIVSDVEKTLLRLKKSHPYIELIHMREPQGCEHGDELSRYLDVPHPKEWQLENCQVRLVMYSCSECIKTKDNSHCEKRDMYEGKTPSKHILMRLEDYITE